MRITNVSGHIKIAIKEYDVKKYEQYRKVIPNIWAS
jgi:hypothetical protein